MSHLRLENADAFTFDVWAGGITNQQAEDLLEEFVDLIEGVGGSWAAALSVAPDAKAPIQPSHQSGDPK